MFHVFRHYIEHLAMAEDEAALRDALRVIAECFELPTFAYLLIPGRVRSATRIISTYQRHWTDHYLTSGYERIDPIILRSGGDVRPFDWGPNFSVDTDTQTRRFFKEAADFGINYGFTIPIHDDFGFAAVTFATDRWHPAFCNTVWNNIHLLQFAAILFHLYARRMLGPPFLIHGAYLSAREHECLCLAAQGKSAWDISRILPISQRSAEFHLGNVRGKLDVHSICQAIHYLGGLR